MKNLVMIFALLVTIFSDINAMQTDKSSGGIPFVLYKVENIKTDFEVIQIPNKLVKLGGITSRFINIDCREYNGRRIFSPIILKHDMSTEEMRKSISKTFNIDVSNVIFREGIMTENIFSQIFPYLPKNW